MRALLVAAGASVFLLALVSRGITSMSPFFTWLFLGTVGCGFWWAWVKEGV